MPQLSLAPTVPIISTLAHLFPADREVDVHRTLMAHARRAGYRMLHVADEPERFGADPQTSKRHEGTLTSWLLLENVQRWPE